MDRLLKLANVDAQDSRRRDDLRTEAATGFVGLGPDHLWDCCRHTQRFKQVDLLRRHRSDHWMQHIGYTREKTMEPQPLGDTETEAAKMRKKIDALRRQK